MDVIKYVDVHCVGADDKGKTAYRFPTTNPDNSGNISVAPGSGKTSGRGLTRWTTFTYRRNYVTRPQAAANMPRRNRKSNINIVIWNTMIVLKADPRHVDLV